MLSQLEESIPQCTHRRPLSDDVDGDLMHCIGALPQTPRFIALVFQGSGIGGQLSLLTLWNIMQQGGWESHHGHRERHDSGSR